MRINFRPTATVEQYSRVPNDGAAFVVLILHRRGRGQETVQVLRDVHRALAIENIMDDVSRLQSSLQYRNVSLGIQKLQDILPE